MIHSLLFTLLLALTALPPDKPEANEGDYRASLIPPLLLINADAVVRDEERRFELQRRGRARLHVREAITILNADGRDYGEFAIYYNSFSNVRNIRAELLDAHGNRIRRLGRRDVRDESAISSISLMEDGRIKRFEMYHDTYPYTIVVEYEVDYSGYVDFPGWYPLRHRASIQRSRYTAVVPSTEEVKYYLANSDIEPEISEEGNMTSYTWELKNHGVPRAEIRGLNWREVAISLHINTSFITAGRSDEPYNSWRDLGEWLRKLWDGRARLPRSEAEKVRELIADTDDDHEKIRRIYRHLQETTRYVSVQLGIGGWQTETAQRTCETRYGDCKALTNLLMGMLREAGFRAYPAFINNGTTVPEFVTEIPNNRFNHVILFVPMEQDTLWIESTSSDYPAGYIGLGNHDRPVLIVGNDGGYLHRTPRYGYMRNTQIRDAVVTLGQDGNASATITTTYTGGQHEYYRYMGNNLSRRDQDTNIRNQISIGRFDIIDFSIESHAKSDTATLHLDLSLPNYASRAGNRLIFQPNLLEQHTRQLPEIERRTHPIRYTYSYYDYDRITYELPEGFRVDTLPETFEFAFTYGNYKAWVEQLEGNRLKYHRQIEIRNERIPPEYYDEYRAFMNSIVLADQFSLMLVRE